MSKVKLNPGQKTYKEISKAMKISQRDAIAAVRKFSERLAYNVILAGFDVDDYSNIIRSSDARQKRALMRMSNGAINTIQEAM
jgi:hypothetical protein